MVEEVFEYEFIFNDMYQDDIYNVFPNKTPSLKAVIEDSATKLVGIITVQPGIRKISSFPSSSGKTYKVTVINTKWVSPV